MPEKQLSLFLGEDEPQDQEYTHKTAIPHYEPSSVCPSLWELVDKNKYQELKNAIQRSGVTQDEKLFLLMSATRHLIFNFSKIADYYAHATPEMQKLMEDSALVIIDQDNAIADGYCELAEKVDILTEKEYAK